ncbi:MAG: MFS transporter [Puniceicoccales bacterium]|jgi:MFS family permease|nr:MFS transporter [Puniceicoccales bacterium]
MQFPWATPYPEINDDSRQCGLRAFFNDGISFQVFFTLTTAPFIVKFAMLFSGSDLFIGLIAAAAPLSQLLQLPTVWLIERVRNRKGIVVTCVLFGRSIWFLVPLIPLLPAASLQAAALLFAQFWNYAFSNIAACAVNSWMRDFIPQNILGTYFGKRYAWGTGTAAVTLLVARLFLPATETSVDEQYFIFGAYFLVAACAGMLSLYFIPRIPEPVIQPKPAMSLHTMLAEPLKSPDFRRVLVFLMTWQFAFGMSWQFFAKYMLHTLEIPFKTVMLVTVCWMLLSAFFYPLWGRLSTRLGNKSVLMKTIPLYLGGLLFWQLGGLVEGNAGIALAFGVYVLGGIAYSGNLLCLANIVMRTVPPGQSGAFFACNSCLVGASAALSSAFGGALSDWFDGKGMFTGYTSHSTSGFTGLNLAFLVAVVIGVASLFLLRRVNEPKI